MEYDEEFFPFSHNEKVKVKVDIFDYLEKHLNEKLLAIWNDRVKYNTEIEGSFWGLTKKIKYFDLIVKISWFLVFLIFLRIFFKTPFPIQR
jgi:hypothetical protein